MTTSLPADKAEALTRAGKKMANILFNIEQRAGIDIDDFSVIKETREEWDRTLAALSAPAPAPGAETNQWRKFAEIVRELGPSMSPGALVATIERRADKLEASTPSFPRAAPEVGEIKRPVLFMDEHGVVFTKDGAAVKAMIEAIPEPTIGRKLLPLVPATALSAKLAEVELNWSEAFKIGVQHQEACRAAEASAADLRRKLEEASTDAERWRALMSSQRMHFMGCAGIELVNKPGTTSRKTVDLIPVMKAGEYQHFGMEFWSEHKAFGDPKYPDDFERSLLVAYVDHLRARALTSGAEQ